ncbi:MAG: hypothetical protein RLZZ141_1077 [Pseudomonadota bacterium]
MGLRLTLVSVGLVAGLSSSALAAENRLPMAKPSSGATTPAPKPYDGKLQIQHGVNSPRLRMAPSTPLTPMKPVKIKPAKK